MVIRNVGRVGVQRRELKEKREVNLVKMRTIVLVGVRLSSKVVTQDVLYSGSS